MAVSCHAHLRTFCTSLHRHPSTPRRPSHPRSLVLVVLLSPLCHAHRHAVQDLEHLAVHPSHLHTTALVTLATLPARPVPVPTAGTSSCVSCHCRPLSCTTHSTQLLVNLLSTAAAVALNCPTMLVPLTSMSTTLLLSFNPLLHHEHSYTLSTPFSSHTTSSTVLHYASSTSSIASHTTSLPDAFRHRPESTPRPSPRRAEHDALLCACRSAGH